jgi:hypothetical protein
MSGFMSTVPVPAGESDKGIRIPAISTKTGIIPERTKLCQQNGHPMMLSVLVNEYMKGEYMPGQVC